ncbi:hypothetical protein QMK61_09220 [Fulvimonas sp. R45]|uniref:hypothetical protein n=1 Tax=Fulvimonas sp. R45 TaxID=3045937 RepID=UPI00265E1C52|nr:hypothetical protein [Fulvimonas sp. R45]MDO1529005.1 hypothetical protein [Fulvimonas sp. R45]
MSARMLARRALPWLLVVVAGLLAAWLRYGLVQPPALAHRCAAGGPAWCPLRELAVRGFLSYAYGWAALAAAALALLWRRAAVAWLAAALGAFALVMYCADGGAPALLVGCLVLLRCQSAGATPVDPDRRGGAQAQRQP